VAREGGKNSQSNFPLTNIEKSSILELDKAFLRIIWIMGGS